MKRLILLRHAKSDWSTGSDDFDRPLNARGKKDSVFMAKMLKRLPYDIDHIYSSPAARAKATAQAAAQKTGADLSFIEDFYLGSRAGFLEVLHRLDDELDTVVFAGHNPAMETFAAHLARMPEHGLTMPTGALICFLQEDGNWQEFGERELLLEWFVRPKLLHKLVR